MAPWHHDSREVVKKLSVFPAVLVASFLVVPRRQGGGVQTSNAEGLLGAECGGEGSKGSSWTQQVWQGEDKGGSEDQQEAWDLKCY